jgi:hypothetical protein
MFVPESRLNPAAQAKHTPLEALQLPLAQLAGHAGTHTPSSEVKFEEQIWHSPAALHWEQLGMLQITQALSTVLPTSWKEGWHWEQVLAAWQVRQLAMVQETQVRLKREKPVLQTAQTSLVEQPLQLATAQEKGKQMPLVKL